MLKISIYIRLVYTRPKSFWISSKTSLKDCRLNSREGIHFLELNAIMFNPQFFTFSKESKLIFIKLLSYALFFFYIGTHFFIVIKKNVNNFFIQKSS